MIFQDPMSSLNPRHTIRLILTEPVLLHGLAQDHAAALALVQGVLDRVGLQRNTVERYSFELSGDSVSASASRAPWCCGWISFSPTRSSPGSTFRRGASASPPQGADERNASGARLHQS